MKLTNLLTALLIVFAAIDFGMAQSQSEINSGFEWVSLEEAQAQAVEEDKKILLFGYAEWCTYCLKTRKETFPDSTVLAAIKEHYIPVQLDGESEGEVSFNGQKLQARELARYLRLSSFPTHYFLSKNGEIIGAQPGFIEPYIYGPLLNYVGADMFGKVGFEEYLKEHAPELLEDGEGN